MHAVYMALEPFGSWLALGIITAIARSRISRNLNHYVTMINPPDQHTASESHTRDPQADPH